jgi:hypothetical protein
LRRLASFSHTVGSIRIPTARRQRLTPIP